MSNELIIQDENKLGFFKFLEANRKAWSNFPETEVEDNAVVFGINAANHPGAVMGNCIFLRFMAHFFKAEPVMLSFNHDDAYMTQLLGSYGIHKTRALTQVTPQIAANVHRLLKEFEERGVKSKRALLNFTFDGVPLGDLVYDGHLRNNMKCSLDSLQDVVYEIKQFCWSFETAKDIFNSHNTKAVLTEFNTFHLQAPICRYAVSKGIPVYMKKPASDIFTVRRFSSLADVAKSEYEFEKEEFLDLYQQYGDFMVREGKKLLNKRFFTPEDVEAHDAKEAFVGSEPAWTREKMLTELGMDPTKPVACVMNHCFIDQPHGQGDLYFDDYVEWLTKTLEFAKKNTGVNWLVREHPHQKGTYKSPILAEDVVRDVGQGCGHIKMMPDEIKTPNLLALVDYMVTCFGSCSLEFPAFGKPCVALPGWTTGYGFNAAPKSQLEYKRTLQSITDVKAPTAEEADLACAYYYNVYALARVKTKLLPKLTGSFLTESKFDVVFAFPFAALLLEETPLTEDSFYRHLKRMVEEGRSSICNYDLLPGEGEAPGPEAAGHAPAAQAADAQLQQAS